jgi:hypothetical protein
MSAVGRRPAAVLPSTWPALGAIEVTSLALESDIRRMISSPTDRIEGLVIESASHGSSSSASERVTLDPYNPRPAGLPSRYCALQFISRPLTVKSEMEYRHGRPSC